MQNEVPGSRHNINTCLTQTCSITCKELIVLENAFIRTDSSLFQINRVIRETNLETCSGHGIQGHDCQSLLIYWVTLIEVVDCAIAIHVDKAFPWWDLFIFRILAKYWQKANTDPSQKCKTWLVSSIVAVSPFQPLVSMPSYSWVEVPSRYWESFGGS